MYISWLLSSVHKFLRGSLCTAAQLLFLHNLCVIVCLQCLWLEIMCESVVWKPWPWFEWTNPATVNPSFLQTAKVSFICKKKKKKRILLIIFSSAVTSPWSSLFCFVFHLFQRFNEKLWTTLVWICQFVDSHSAWHKEYRVKGKNIFLTFSCSTFPWCAFPLTLR